MTVKELIEELQQFDQTLEVYLENVEPTRFDDPEPGLVTWHETDAEGVVGLVKKVAL